MEFFSSQCYWKQRSRLSSYFLLSALVATFSCGSSTKNLFLTGSKNYSDWQNLPSCQSECLTRSKSFQELCSRHWSNTDHFVDKFGIIVKVATNCAPHTPEQGLSSCCNHGIFFKPMLLKTTITFIFIFSFVRLGGNIFLLPHKNHINDKKKNLFDLEINTCDLIYICNTP
jgi:hypothetical protein